MATILGSRGMRGQWGLFVLSESALRLELSQGRPLILGYTAISGGHVVVIYGYTQSGQFLMADPWGGVLYLKTYTQLATHGAQAWTMTFHLMASVQCWTVTNEAVTVYPRIISQLLPLLLITHVLATCLM